MTTQSLANGLDTTLDACHKSLVVKIRWRSVNVLRLPKIRDAIGHESVPTLARQAKDEVRQIRAAITLGDASSEFTFIPVDAVMISDGAEKQAASRCMLSLLTTLTVVAANDYEA